MTGPENDAADYGGVAFPSSAPPERPRASAVADADLAETARRKHAARIVEDRLKKATPMGPRDRFVMSRNARDYIYGLSEAKRLKITELGEKFCKRPLVAAIQFYVAPQGIDTYEELCDRHPNRRVAAKPRLYAKLVVAAADMAGDEKHNALLALVSGTRFLPGAEDVDDDERQAANEIVETLSRVAGHLRHVFPVERYFDLIGNHEVLPSRQADGLIFKQIDDFDWYEHEAAPVTRLAHRWLEPARLPVVVAVAKVAPDEGEPVDFEALHAEGRSIEGHVGVREICSIGIGWLDKRPAPIALISSEVVLSPVGGFQAVRHAKLDQIHRGWNQVALDDGSGPVRAAWKLKEPPAGLADPDDDDGEGPPEVVLKLITAAWLLDRSAGRWRLMDTTGPSASLWRGFAETQSGRLSDRSTLGSIVERALLANGQSSGVIHEIRDAYARNVEALRKWKANNDSHAQARLSILAARLSADQ